MIAFAAAEASSIAQLAQSSGPLISSSLNSAVGLQCADKPVPPKLGDPAQRHRLPVRPPSVQPQVRPAAGLIAAIGLSAR
jgi:hypothetical protein